VRDLAIVLDVTVGFDASDPQTTASVGKIPESYYAALSSIDPTTLRLGLLEDWFGSDLEEIELGNRVKALLAILEAEGTEVIELRSPRVNESLSGTPFFVSEVDFRKDMTAYLAANPSLGFSSLESLLDDPRIVPNVANLLRPLLGSAHESEINYLRQRAQRSTIRGALLTLMHEHRLDALVYPTATREAAEIGKPHTHFNCQLAANSGLPAISVPAGFGPNQMPIAVEFLAESWSEQKLLDLALTVETLAPARALPRHTP
jgi:Asp-tRNA(Asn)/Glu-tRNA(Gln) amidotransferase A subunit family amidase